jgi:hypothetical protein
MEHSARPQNLMNAGFGSDAVIAIFLTKLNYWHTQKILNQKNNVRWFHRGKRRNCRGRLLDGSP